MVMTLKEAIAHAHEKGKGDDECAAEHRSLATFLEELLMYRQTTAIIIGENAAEKVGQVYLKKPDAVRVEFPKGRDGSVGSFKPDGQIRILDHAEPQPFKKKEYPYCPHRQVLLNSNSNSCFCSHKDHVQLALDSSRPCVHTICDDKLLVPALIDGRLICCDTCKVTAEKDEAPHDGSACFYRHVEYDMVEHKGLYPGQRITSPGRRRVRCSHPTVLKAMNEHMPAVLDAAKGSMLHNTETWLKRQHSVRVPTTLNGVTYACAGCTLCTSKPIEGA